MTRSAAPTRKAIRRRYQRADRASTKLIGSQFGTALLLRLVIVLGYSWHHLRKKLARFPQGRSCTIGIDLSVIWRSSGTCCWRVDPLAAAAGSSVW